ncbi:MAG TPA: PilN domain-containing protein [bacterium]|nr:PilN domain-containing protein [bacterium]
MRTIGQVEPGFMRIELNLVPAALQQRREGVSRRRVLVAVAVLPVLGLGALYAVLVIDARQAQEASRDYDARLTAVRPVAIEVSLLQGEIADLEQRQQRLSGLVGQRQPRLSPLLAEMSRLVPADVWLQSLTIDAGVVTVAGNALHLRSVAVFAAHLDESPLLAQLRVVGLQEVEGERTITQFQMTAHLRPTP